MPRIRRAVFASIIVVSVLSGFALRFVIVPGQVDTFDSDLQSWKTGSSSPNPPTHEADGGPLGAGDGYMKATTSGIGGPGGALVVFNAAQWAGDYLDAGVTSISMDVRNLGLSDLDLRLLIESGSPRYYSATPVRLQVGGGWTNIVFDLDEGSLAANGPADYATVMADVTQLRIYHSTDPQWPAPEVNGALGVDNIRANAAGTSSSSPANLDPQEIVLAPPYPNPAASIATVELLSPNRRYARVSVVDLLGREVQVAFDGETTGLRTNIDVDVQGLAPGLYLVRAEIAGRSIVRTMTVVHP